jgi:hypothetical protein
MIPIRNCTRLYRIYWLLAPEPENRVATAFEVGQEALIAYDIRRDAYKLGWIVTVEYLKEASRLDFGHFAE